MKKTMKKSILLVAMLSLFASQAIAKSSTTLILGGGVAVLGGIISIISFTEGKENKNKLRILNNAKLLDAENLSHMQINFESMSFEDRIILKEMIENQENATNLKIWNYMYHAALIGGLGMILVSSGFIAKDLIFNNKKKITLDEEIETLKNQIILDPKKVACLEIVEKNNVASISEEKKEEKNNPLEEKEIVIAEKEIKNIKE